MTIPNFWRGSTRWRPIRLLAPLALVYGEIAKRLMMRTGGHPGAPVVAVGAPTVGGVFKTLSAIAIARLMAGSGEHPALVARGHGGQIALGGPPTRVDRHVAAQVGDEPLIMARTAPTFVGLDITATALLAVDEATPSVLILDDALHSKRLEPDVAIVVVDAAVGFGNGMCLPAGPLRAPLRAILSRVAVLLIVGEGAPGELAAQTARVAGCPVLRAHLEADGRARALAGRDVVAFSGMRSPERFFLTLIKLGARLVETAVYPERHMYEPDDLARLVGVARVRNALLVTTEADAVRLPTLPEGAPGALFVPVCLKFEDEAEAASTIQRGLARARPWQGVAGLPVSSK